MTQVWDDAGQVHPATIIKTEPLVVTQVKTADKDGYVAVQVGYGTKKDSNIKKAQKGHYGELGSFAGTMEFRLDETELNKGDSVSLETFAEGDVVEVSGTSKGKGFQGVVKRHGFAGGRRSHGQKHSEREPGSIGSTGPQRVFKGVRMAGRMGGDRVTVKNLKVLKVDSENNLLYIAGAVPGRRGTLVEVKSA